MRSLANEVEQSLERHIRPKKDHWRIRVTIRGRQKVWLLIPFYFCQTRTEVAKILPMVMITVRALVRALSFAPLYLLQTRLLKPVKIDELPSLSIIPLSRTNFVVKADPKAKRQPRAKD